MAGYFTLAELRAFDSELASVERHPDGVLEDARLLAEESLEEATHRAFVVRERTELVTVHGDGSLRVGRHDPRAVISATIDGEPVADVATGARFGWATITGLSVPTGRQVLVTYRHGMDTPPRRVKRAAMILAKEEVLRGPITDRAVQVPVGDGAVVNLALGEFGIPEVNKVVEHYRIRSLGGIA